MSYTYHKGHEPTFAEKLAAARRALDCARKATSFYGKKGSADRALSLALEAKNLTKWSSFDERGFLDAFLANLKKFREENGIH